MLVGESTSQNVSLQPIKPIIFQAASKEGLSPLLFTPEVPHGVMSKGLRSQHRKDIDVLGQVQRRAMKMIAGMEFLSYEERLR